VLNNESSLLGLTTLRDYDEYTFVHSVNVCIFAVALSRRLGLSRLQLYDIGFAALFHDIGKSRVPVGILNKPDLHDPNGTAQKIIAENHYTVAARFQAFTIWTNAGK